MEDSAPVVETDPISSWLKSAIAFTFPSRILKLGDDAKVAMASTAQNLVSVVRQPSATGKGHHLRRELIVHTGAEDKLAVQTTQDRRLRIVQVPEK